MHKDKKKISQTLNTLAFKWIFEILLMTGIEYGNSRLLFIT